ncbi:MAG: 16S rRNA (guanine(966)-N(2))-methyltransferase RsmD, partial [Brachymonas sp.]|nr:16S rRNA (guanine(966)-N(2))-methyltransferase RsmD [Brachymonas sp.]
RTDKNQPPGEVRFIGGQWRSRKLPVAQGPTVPEGLRPTPDRVRETLFNWLGQDLGGWHCVDVCAGTGALGFEAASRGAVQVFMVEQHAALVKQLRANQQRLDAQAVQVVAGDGLAFLREQAARAPGSVDVVFFDPPFDSTLYAAALESAKTLLTPEGCFYLESAREWPAEELAALGWERWRYLRAGAVHAHLLRPLA